jgi:hypothetical protein
MYGVLDECAAAHAAQVSPAYGKSDVARSARSGRIAGPASMPDIDLRAISYLDTTLALGDADVKGRK